MTKALGKEAMEELMRRMSLVKTQGRSAIAPRLAEDGKEGVQDFEVEKDIDSIEASRHGGSSVSVQAANGSRARRCCREFPGLLVA